MGYKKMDQNFGFADLALESSLKHNRSLKISLGEPHMKLNEIKNC